MFHLKRNESELESSNVGFTKYGWQQVVGDRSVSNNDFSRGNISYKFSTSGNTWYLPSKSYFRLRCSLRDVNGEPLRVDQNIGPEMNLASHLWQKIQVLVNGKIVNTLDTNIPQVWALDYRSKKTKEWFDTIGVNSFWQPDVEDRIKKTGEEVKIRTEMGFDAAGNTIAVNADGDRITFVAGGNALPVLANTFVAGDRIRLSTGATYKITSVRSVTELNVTAINGHVVGTAVAPATDDFVSYRPKPTSSDKAVASDMEIVFQLPLGLMNYKGALPPNMEIEIIMTPQTDSVYKKMVVQSTGVDKTPTTDYNFSVDKLHYYIATVEGPQTDSDMEFLIEMDNIRMQSEPAVGGSSSDQKNVNVSPSTHQITVALMDKEHSTSTLVSGSKFKGKNGDDLRLTRLSVKYAGHTSPNPDCDQELDEYKSFHEEMYTRTLMTQGMYFSPFVGESYEDFKERGPYYAVAFPKDRHDGSTNATISYSLSGASASGDNRLLIFDSYRTIAKIVYRSGRVADVQVSDA